MGIVIVPIWIVAQLVLIYAGGVLRLRAQDFAGPDWTLRRRAALAGFFGGFAVYLLSLWLPLAMVTTDALLFMAIAVIGWPVWIAGLLSARLLREAKRSQRHRADLISASVGCARFIPWAGVLGTVGGPWLEKALHLSVKFTP